MSIKDEKNIYQVPIILANLMYLQVAELLRTNYQLLSHFFESQKMRLGYILLQHKAYLFAAQPVNLCVSLLLLLPAISKAKHKNV
jgi:hypothetical protein